MKYAKKSLGQNFLVDNNIVNKIVNLTEIKNKNILEIGPGNGALTNKIIEKKPKSLILIEKDSLLSEKLKSKYKKDKKIKVYNEDILKFNFDKKLKKDTVIFGNLPYNISSQILVKIIRLEKFPPLYSSIIFMFQKEMAERIIGKFGSSKYGRLSILTNFKLNIKNKFNVSPNCFFPKPKVNSTVLLFKPKNENLSKIRKIQNLEKVTNIFFSNKRKMINKSIKKIFKNEVYKKLIREIDTQLRPTDLKPEKYYKITELFEKD